MSETVMRSSLVTLSDCTHSTDHRSGPIVPTAQELAMPPNALLDSLKSVRRKVKALSVTFGMASSVAAAVGLLLLVLLIDYALGLDKGPRLFLVITAVAALGYVFYQWVIVPARSKLGVSDLAGRIEHTFPQFDDRLRSTVDFVQQNQIPGSEAMKQPRRRGNLNSCQRR